ncbi:MAG: acyltransferase family protein [Thermodesulfobacteriota bacterium]
MRDKSLDLMKALSIVAVLYWHLQPFEYKVDQNNLFTHAIHWIKYYLNFEITSMAVPVLLLVSLYLFFLKTLDDQHYFRKRIKRLFNISAFWISFQFVLFLWLQPIKIPGDKILPIILMGGPDLPLAGGSVFYYLVVLMLLISLLHFLILAHIEQFGPMNVFFIILLLSYFEYMNLTGNNIPYWRIDSFLIYIPTIVLIQKKRSEWIRRRYFFIAGFLLFSIQDLFLGNLGGNNSHYARASVYFGAVGFFLFCMRLKTRENKLVDFLSAYTLGIFAMHKYWLMLLLILFNELYNRYEFGLYLNFMGLRWHWLYFCITILTVVVTMLAAAALSLTPVKQFVK